MTRATVEVANPLGISEHDHIIDGKEGHASLKALKLIYGGTAVAISWADRISSSGVVSAGTLANNGLLR